MGKASTKSRAVTKLPRAEQWADRIGTQMAKSVEAIIEVGRLLVKAKADLSHGEWGRLFDEGLVPFKQRWAEMLMGIAEHKALNSHNCANLPASVSTLYELTRLPPAQLRAAFKDELITPDMSRAAVKALAPRAPLEPAEQPFEDPPIAVIARNPEHDRISSALEPARDVVRDWPETWPFTFVIFELEHLLAHVRRVEAHRAKVSA